jgi:hypothetical protein
MDIAATAAIVKSLLRISFSSGSMLNRAARF